MSYAIQDASIESGQPVELYEFVQREISWYFNTSVDPVVHNGITYVPANIARSGYSVSNEIDKSQVVLTFPRDASFVAQFIAKNPDFVTTLTIKRGHTSDSVDDFIVYWKGRVLSAKSSGSRVELTCESVFSSMRRHGLRARYQRNCRHVLYGSACGVLQATHTIAAQVTGQSGDEASLTAVGSYADGYFSGGILKLPSGGLRFITNHTGSVVKLNKPLDADSGGLNVEVSPGCDHLKATCHSKFNNVINFGGFPYIPGVNPFGGTSLV